MYSNSPTYDTSGLGTVPSSYGAGLVTGLYKGTGGYIYFWQATKAAITITYSPAAGGRVQIPLTPGSAAYSAVLYEITRIGAPNVSNAEAQRISDLPVVSPRGPVVVPTASGTTSITPVAEPPPSALPIWEQSWFPPVVVLAALGAALAFLKSRKRR